MENGGKVIPLPAAGQPFDPEWRLYARGSGDDKAPHRHPGRARRPAGQQDRSSRTSSSRSKARKKPARRISRIPAPNKDLFRGDVWLICDGPLHQSRRQTDLRRARHQIVDITVYGPRRELHSGHYGNWAPNPAMMLAQLLASMKDDEAAC